MSDIRKISSKKGTPGSGKFSVFEIQNLKNGKKHYMLSSYYTLTTILSAVKSYTSSRTVKGGAETLAQDIDNAGKDYKEKFKVREMGSGLSEVDAEKLRAELVNKAGAVYNQEIDVV